MRVVWTARARARLAEIHDYISRQSPERALAMVERILRRVDQLASTPRSGARLTAFRDDEIRELLERPYRVIYRVAADRLDIITIKHYRQRLVDRPTDLE